jgi:hypothetical protein
LDVQRLIGDNAFESPVLVLKGAQPLGLIHLEAAVLPAPRVERRLRDPVAPQQFGQLGARRRCLLQDPDDLLVGEAIIIGEVGWAALYLN